MGLDGLLSPGHFDGSACHHDLERPRRCPSVGARARAVQTRVQTSPDVPPALTKCPSQNCAGERLSSATMWP